MIDNALPYLRCPVCGDSLQRVDRTVRCPKRHSFDLAKQGYADLSGGRLPHVGDTAAMVADRMSFLAAGHYDFIADALAAEAGEAGTGEPEAAGAGTGSAGTAVAGTGSVGTGSVGTGSVAARGGAGDDDAFTVDAGTGTGFYLARVLDARGGAGLGLDVSKPALRRAATAHPRAAAALADLWRALPIRDGAASTVLNVFAPRNGAEFRRVLRPDGLLLVVTPAADHLAELVERFGLLRVDPDKADRVEATLGAHFTAVGSRELRRRLSLTPDEVRTLIGMTPSARHISEISEMSERREGADKSRRPGERKATGTSGRAGESGKAGVSGESGMSGRVGAGGESGMSGRAGAGGRAGAREAESGSATEVVAVTAAVELRSYRQI